MTSRVWSTHNSFPGVSDNLAYIRQTEQVHLDLLPETRWSGVAEMVATRANYAAEPTLAPHFRII